LLKLQNKKELLKNTFAKMSFDIFTWTKLLYGLFKMKIL
jgi:hypothetical protein